MTYQDKLPWWAGPVLVLACTLMSCVQAIVE
jgi:hypothetical protein